MHQSLYRKYRPSNFDDIAGQKNIVKIIKNAIKTEKVSHAYLFCGPRGTGKTSTAKILAQTLNCEANKSNPCGKCPSCVDNNMDVLEIDGASNNGVDNIRELREGVKYAPTSKYKVYIIDEVHMLSTSAFNALLKTLEEPPAHVIFILATTEPEKVLDTIISRCQRLDFRNIGVEDIVERLEFISNQENVKYEKSALCKIAKIAKGGMRDAISILDQVISFSNEATLKNAEEVLGVANSKSISDTINSFFNKDMKKGIEIAEEITKSGKNTEQFIEDLVFYIRDNIKEFIKKDNDEQIKNSLFFLDLLEKALTNLKNGSCLDLEIIKIINANNFCVIKEDEIEDKGEDEVENEDEVEEVKTDINLEKISEYWESHFMKRLSFSPQLASFMKEAKLKDFKNNTVFLETSNKLVYKKISEQFFEQIVEKLRKTYKRPFKLDVSFVKKQ